jgi:hypothetical protein
LKFEDLRRGLVRVCDAEGDTRGTGFFVSEQGHVLTCDHVVRDVQQLFVETYDGRKIPAIVVSDMSLPELDFAVLETNTPPELVIPIEFAGTVGDRIWASGFQMQGGAIKDVFPTLGTVAGRTALEYNLGEQRYNLPEILRLENATVEPGLSGAPAVLEHEGVAIGLVNARLNQKGGFILPFSATARNSAGVNDLLRRNRRSVPRYGKFVNWPGLAQLCRTQTTQMLGNLEQSGRYSAKLYVKRQTVEEVAKRFLTGDSRVLPIVGQTGTGKTNFAAHVAEVLQSDHPTALLLAYRLSPEPEGIAASVAKELSKESRNPPALTAADLLAVTADEWQDDLIVILDGLNELPGTIDRTREWLESTWVWLRKSSRVRLITTCRPETWNLVRDFFDSDLVYSEVRIVLRKKDEQESAERVVREAKQGFPLGEFSAREARRAGRRYGLPVLEQAGIFRHPLLFGIAQRSLRNSGNIPTPDGLFAAYVESVVNRIQSARSHPPSSILIRSKIEQLASMLRAGKNLWLDKKQFLATFSSDSFLGDAFLGEHLLVEGEYGIRFAFDDIAYYLIAQSAGKELEQAISTRIESWGKFREDDPIGLESIPFLLMRLEAQGKHQVVMGVLTTLAVQSHTGDVRHDYYHHILFLRFLQWLKRPSAYFSAVELFAENCSSNWVRFRGDKFHNLVSLLDLPGITLNQQLRLLSIMAKLEPNWGNRWGDWDQSSDKIFWSGGSRPSDVPTFLKHVKRMLAQSGEAVIPMLLQWLEDDTKLTTHSPPSEATVSDLACGILFHSCSRWLDPICDGLALLATANPLARPEALLQLITWHHPVEMVGVCERWEKSRQFDQFVVARTMVCALSLVPEAFTRALDLTEQLIMKGVWFDTSVLARLMAVDPDRALKQVKFIIEHHPDLSRRQSAVIALRELAEIPGRLSQLLSVVGEYLQRYAELSSWLSGVIANCFYGTEPDSDAADVVAEWTRNNFSKVISDARQPIISGVLVRAEGSPAGMALLKDVIEAETSDGNLIWLLGRLARARLARNETFALTQRVAEKLVEQNPAGDSLLHAVAESGNEQFGKYLAAQIAANPKKWPQTHVEFSELVSSGKRAFDAATDVLSERRWGRGWLRSRN